MTDHSVHQKIDPMRVIKKFFLSAFVVITFIAYALHKPSGSDVKLGAVAQPPEGSTSTETQSPANPIAPPTGATSTQQQDVPPPTALAPTPVPPTATSQPNLTANGGYRDGTYTGPEVDALYGLVQVQAVIQNGKIVNVQFLEYPNDRRTSVRINSIAVPYLQQEAIQAQNANVDLVTGATLTSEAFQMSLGNALSQAKGSL